MKVTSARSFSLVAVIALAAATACGRASNGPATPAAAAPSCERGYAVNVVNNSDHEMDIWAFPPKERITTTSPRRVLIGTVAAHTSRVLPLTGDTTVVAVPPGENPPRRKAGEVILHVHCG